MLLMAHSGSTLDKIMVICYTIDGAADWDEKKGIKSRRREFRVREYKFKTSDYKLQIMIMIHVISVAFSLIILNIKAGRSQKVVILYKYCISTRTLHFGTSFALAPT